MLIDQVTSAGALPALEMTLRFAGQRQRVLAHNVANLSTPDFRPQDVSVRGFQDTLREAIHQRRARNGGTHGGLQWKATRELETGSDGALRLNPRSPAQNVLFQDRNNRDLERLMQAVAENTAAFRVASDLMRQQSGMLRAAMAERVA